MKKTVNVWMQLLGFEKNDPDRGADRFVKQVGFCPDNVCALLFHPDFVHLHRGMEEEYELFPDNCAYRAIPRNVERARQAWTNYDLRTLIAELKKKGVGFYAGIMGTYVEDLFHHEWLSDHPEIRATSIRGKRNLMCLKRFVDGTYYEDFFVEKLLQTLTDYDLAGVHISDGFCPADHLYKIDYSTDMVEQFLAHTGEQLPRAVAATMGDDSPAGASARQAYLWGERRASWICFWEWRWEQFFRKVCTAVHGIGKQVWILGMYCSDPFETRYVYGFDTRRVMDAGVDAITANILPSSVNFENPAFPYYFHRMHMDLPLLRAQLGDTHGILSMLGVQDASEEWSILDHAPVRLERDIYLNTAFVGRGEGGERATDGVFFCLGDGLPAQKWHFLKERTDIGFSAPVKQSWSPVVLWSDAAHERMLEAYIQNRRTSVHKQAFEVFKAGTPLGGALRSERISTYKGVLFVPNYDLLDESERQALAAYEYPYVGTAPANFPLLDRKPTYVCQDWNSDYPMKAFICGAELSAEERAEIDELLSVEEAYTDAASIPEREVHPPIAELPFTTLSAGFLSAVGVLLRVATYSLFPVKADRPMLALGLENGCDRLYFFNPYDNGYVDVKASSEASIEHAEVASAYPVLPVKFFHQEAVGGVYRFDDTPAEKHEFKIKLAPDGVSIVDIKRKQN